MLFKSASVNMAGCCTASDRQDCGWASSCVDSSAYAGSGCGSNCRLDPLVRKCTRALAPYCVTWTYPSDGVSDYGCDSTSTNAISTVLLSASGLSRTSSLRLPTVAANALATSSARASSAYRPFATSSLGSGSYGGSGTSGGTSYTDTDSAVRKTLAIGTIIGIVIGVLTLLFFVAIGIFMCIKKKKKNALIANNANIIASNQAFRPQSQFQPQGPPPPQAMSPAPSNNGYFAPPPPQNMQEQKYNPHASVSEYNMTPISNPGSPPPPQYNQPYGAPPMQQQPQQQQQQYQYVANGAHEVAAPVPQQSVSPVQQQQNNVPMQPNAGPAPPTGAHEVDAISAPNAPGKTGPVYEIGGR